MSTWRKRARTNPISFCVQRRKHGRYRGWRGFSYIYIYVYQQFVQFVDRVPIVAFDMGSLLLFRFFFSFFLPSNIRKKDIGKKQKQRRIVDLLHTDKSDEHLAKSCRHTFGGDRFSRRLSIPPILMSTY
jgi:hypothetical protein